MRATGRLGIKQGERYALLPDEVLESAAYCAQPDWAKVALFALCAQYHGNNNGDLSLPFSEAKRLGVSAQWKLYAGLKLLELSGLVTCTRRGHLTKGTKLCSLYAVTWRGINPTNNTLDVGVNTSPLPSHAWAKWRKPDDWAARVKAVEKTSRGRREKSSHLTWGNGSLPTGVATVPNIAPYVEVTESPFIAPHGVVTSKILGGGTPATRKLTRKGTSMQAIDEGGA